MRAIEAAKAVLEALTALSAAKRRRQTGFVCGDCERWKSCGLPSNDNCVVMLAQIERDESRYSSGRSASSW